MGFWSMLKNAGSQVTASAMNATGGSSAQPGKLSPKFGGESVVVPNIGSTTSYPDYTPNINVNASGGLPSWLSGMGSALGGLGSIVGGFLSYGEQKKANKIAERQWAENMAFQKDQYYNAMYNRVQDARRAGVHPLAALGISAHGSASPTAHVQSATGLGQAMQGLSGAVNTFFENMMRSKQMALLTSQIQANQALAMKYKADTAHSMADTDYIRKNVANYHVYRIWNSINNSLGSVGRLIKPGPVFNRTTNYQPLYQDIY